MASESKSASAKPWDEWPHELPTTTELRDMKVWQQLEDETFHREMGAEVHTH